MSEKERILIVDDDEGTRRSLSLIFNRKGYETAAAGTGEAALKLARQGFFNLALLDIKLPDMEGVELLAPLKGIHPDMEMIMVTAHASLETAMQALNRGASLYITKPLNMDEVLSTIREVLEKQRLRLENRRLLQEVQRELVERKRAQEELRLAHEQLEMRVEERTAELARANEELREEIAERKRMEEQVKTALEEKEVLLREIHHRVKNNLQTTSSLLSLQSGYIEDQQALDILQSSQQRIRTMALIHEKLYQSRDLSRIEFREYVQSLVTYLFELYSLQSEQVQLNMQIEDVVLDIDTSIPAGLIINELVSNSLKYAFPDFRKGELRIILEKSKEEERDYDYTLIVGDNGIGLPRDLDFRESGTLGMVLVNSLVKQLNGVIDLDTQGGTTYTIKFQKLEYEKRI